MDLTVPRWDDRVAILLGDGAGGFAAAPGSPVPVGSHPSSVAVADFNGDLKVDLAVANSYSTELSILLGDGVGGFGTASSVPVPMGPRSLAVADLNRDGKPDLAVASRYSRDVTILLGDGLGSFNASHFAVGRMATSVIVADFNTDGKLDVAVATPPRMASRFDSGTARVVSGRSATRPLQVPTPWSLAAAELNGDGKVDLAVAEAGKIEILLQTPSTPTVARGRTPKGHRPDAVLATRGEITKLAIDGPRAAVMTTKIKGVCGRIVVWAPPGRRTTSFASTKSCGSILCGAGRCVDALALGDGHVAWITRAGGQQPRAQRHPGESLRWEDRGHRLGHERERCRGRSERRLGRRARRWRLVARLQQLGGLLRGPPGLGLPARRPGDGSQEREARTDLRRPPGRREARRGCVSSGRGRRWPHRRRDERRHRCSHSLVAPASRRSPPWTGIRRAPSH